MLLLIIAHLFRTESKVPEEYMRMLRSEYRSVSPEYVELFLQQNKRLPTQEELQHAV